MSAVPGPLAAQYFGRNKVQYDDFDFEVLRTEHFEIHFYEKEQLPVVEDFGRMAERWYERFARTFQFALRERRPILVYANKADFQQTNAISGFLSQGTGGVTESLKDRVIMPLAGTQAETDHVLGHELVHSFQYALAGAQRGGGATAFDRMPPWFVEGMPEYLSLGREDAHAAMWMRDAVLHDRIPTIRELTTSMEFFPYRFGHALFAYIAGVYGDEAVPALFRAVGERGLEGGFREVLGTHPDSLSPDWVNAQRSHFEPLIRNRTAPKDAGRRILAPDVEAGEMNLSPALSPDGERVAFFSEKDLFTVDLYLADARTGEVEGKLVSSNRNPHFDNLFFISSAGSWSPDGSRFAFVTFADGDNQIAIARTDDRQVERTLPLEGIGAVYAVDWSPDGSTLVFSGSSGGVTDLFLVEVESGEVEQLTRDRFAELHPSWSPDGQTIVFGTDRGPDADFQRLDLPPMGLGFLDRSTGEVEVRRPMGGAKHINPQWSPDGESVYFISDPLGFSDIYRMELSGGRVFQVTNLATGVSGVSAHSPAFSVARNAGSLAMTVFEEGSYIGYTLSAEEARGEPTSRGSGTTPLAAVLPPASARSRLVAEYLADDTLGLEPASGFQTRDYEPGLSLDYLAQPSVGVAVDRFGTAVGGSVAAFFSDMLGDHQLGVALQAQGQVEDIGGQVAYMNRGGRLTWGAQAGRIPYRTGFTRSGTTERDGETVRYVDFAVVRTALNRGAVVLEYPFNRTSRLETNAGVTRFTYDRDVTRSFFDSQGAFLGREEVDPSQVGLQAPEPLTLYHGMLAYVGDFSFFGFTSPVRGGRHRFEVEGNFGDLSFVNVTGDYRRYLFFNPVTLGFRAVHYGRYGPDAENDRLTPLYLGHETLVRGYSVYSFRGSECSTGGPQDSSCPELDRLVGSKVVVGNVEIRLPLLGNDRFGLISGGFLPVELSFFADAGVAWTKSSDPELTFSTEDLGRIPVFSLGSSLRFNLAGRLVMELYWAYPFQRNRAGLFGFHLAPGW